MTSQPGAPAFEGIVPPRATRPDEACRLVSDAVSDGDLDAALAHYEPDAVVVLADGTSVNGHDALRRMLSQAAESKMLYEVAVERTVIGPDLALVLGRWTSRGTDPAGQPVSYTGTHRSVVRFGADGHWRIALEAITP